MGLLQLSKELMKFSFLLQQTVVRELRVRYKQTVIGVMWAVLQPLVFATVFYFLFGNKMAQFFPKHIENDNVMQFVILFISMSFWMFFNNSITLSTTSITGHPGLVTKVYFPRQVFPLSFLSLGLVDLGFNLLLTASVCLFKGMIPSWQGMIWFLVSALLLIILTAGCSILLAGLNVFYRDFKYIMPVGMQVLFFMTPVFYPPEFVGGRLQTIIELNPLSPLMEGLRQVFTQSHMPMEHFLINALLIIVWAEITLRIFGKLNDKMADVI